MSKYDETPITVYRLVGHEKTVCNLGDTHEVKVYTQKKLGPVVEYRDMDHGYYVRATAVRKDRQGREYHYKEAIDYWGGGSWLRLIDNKHFDSRMQGRFTRLCTENLVGGK